MDTTRMRCASLNVMRGLLAALCVSLGAAAPSAFAQVSVGVTIGINVPTYPTLVRVPGYPVYYARGLPANYFFYGGRYWVYAEDNWYDSLWYDGPWTLVQPEFVPVYVLRVPVRYYVRPPPYFRGWAGAAPPRWGERYGPAWEQRHHGWDHWNRASMPPPAPLPIYQRQYVGPRYPRSAPQQQALHTQHYRHPSKEAVVQQQDGQRGKHEARDEPNRHPPVPPPPQRAQTMPAPHEQHDAAPNAHRPSRGEQAAPHPEQRPPESRGAPHEPPQPGAHHGDEKQKGKGKDKDKDKREDREP